MAKILFSSLVEGASMLNNLFIGELKEHMGCLGSSVDWALNSWFWRRPWSPGCGFKPQVGFYTRRGNCLGFSFFPPLPLLHSACALSLSLSENKEHTQIQAIRDIEVNVPQKQNLSVWLGNDSVGHDHQWFFSPLERIHLHLYRN